MGAATSDLVRPPLPDRSSEHVVQNNEKEVTAVAVRLGPAVAVVAAAAGVFVAVARERRLRRAAVAERLTAGCAHRDVAVLATLVEEFGRRLALPVPGVGREQVDRPVEEGGDR